MSNYARPLKKSFWITNITKKSISLGDLGLSIDPWCSMNLLDTGHHPNLTEAMIKASAASGSLFLKQKYVVIRDIPPAKAKIELMPFDRNIIFTKKVKSIVKNEQVNYEELALSDDKYAEESLDLGTEDHASSAARKK